MAKHLPASFISKTKTETAITTYLNILKVASKALNPAEVGESETFNALARWEWSQLYFIHDFGTLIKEAQSIVKGGNFYEHGSSRWINPSLVHQQATSRAKRVSPQMRGICHQVIVSVNKSCFLPRDEC